MRTSCLCRASWEAPKGAEEGVPPEDLSPDDVAARAEEAARKRLEDDVRRDAALAAWRVLHALDDMLGFFF